MAQVRITRRWPDGEEFEVVVRADNTYPEALAVARANAIAGLAEGMGVIVSQEDDESTEVD